MKQDNRKRGEKPFRNFMAKAMMINRCSGTRVEPPKRGKGSQYSRKGRDGHSDPSFLLTILA